MTKIPELIHHGFFPENSRTRNLRLHEDELFYGSDLEKHERSDFINGVVGSPYTTPDPQYILGGDDSHWGRWLDFTNTKQAGMEFWFQKAMDGTVRNAYFEQNFRNAYSNGLIVAPYAWLYPDNKVSCKAQARAYWDFLVELGIDITLAPVIDFEWTNYMGSPANPDWDDLSIWVTEFTRLSGIKPILYTAKGYADNFGKMPDALRAKFSGFWFANYGVSSPNLPLGFTGWDFWQFTASLEQLKYAPSSVDKKELDGNYWYSTLEELQRIAGIEGGIPPVEPPPVDPSDLLYTGKVKSNATPYVILRDAPAGNDILHLYPDAPIEGKGALVYANGYNRMELTSPQAGWIASEFLDYQVVGELPPEVPDDILTNPFSGVSYHQITRYGYKTFVVIIDMDSKKRAHVTNTKGNLVTVGTMATGANAQIAINGDAWQNVSPYMPEGIAVSDGTDYSNQKTGVPFLNINPDNTMEVGFDNYSGLYNAVAGFRHLIENGLKKDYLSGSEIQYTERHPRSAKGITSDGRLILIGSEGRNSVGLGITLSELADIFLEFNTNVAFDNDSGGSFSLVIDGVLQNVPSNPNDAERAVVNHLLIFIDEDTGGGQPPMGDLKLTTAEAGKSRNVRRDPPVGDAHIFGNTFTVIPSTGFAIADDSYEYTSDVYSNGNLVAKNGDIWYRVISINDAPVDGGYGWTGGIHLGVPQVNVEVLVPPVDPPVIVLPDSVWLSETLDGERTEYRKVV